MIEENVSSGSFLVEKLDKSRGVVLLCPSAEQSGFLFTCSRQVWAAPTERNKLVQSTWILTTQIFTTFVHFVSLCKTVFDSAILLSSSAVGWENNVWGTGEMRMNNPTILPPIGYLESEFLPMPTENMKLPRDLTCKSDICCLCRNWIIDVVPLLTR